LEKRASIALIAEAEKDFVPGEDRIAPSILTVAPFAMRGLDERAYGPTFR
jgi:hypothetical protein